MNMGSTTEYRRAPGETTEWEDILHHHGIIEKQNPKPKSESEDEGEKVDFLEGKSAEELDLLEDDEMFDDVRVIEEYRRKRLAEMKAAAKKNKFGSVLPLERPEYVREVTEASNECWVVLHMHQGYVEKSVALGRILTELAKRHPSTKFMRIIATNCVEGFPDSQVPAVLVYHDGDNVATLSGKNFGGTLMNPECVEYALAEVGAVKTDLEYDPRDEAQRTRFTHIRKAQMRMLDEEDDV